MVRSLIGCGLLLLAFAAHAGAAPPEIVNISVSHLAKHAGWRVRYRLAKPAAQLRFSQEFGAHRHGRWQVETAGLSLIEKDGREYLARDDGKPFRQASLRFASDISKLEKDYPLNKRFTDGSEWLCVLHLYAVPLRGAEPDPKAQFRLRLEPLPRESIVLDGARHRGAMTWVDPHGDRGTFVYFGTITPVQSPHVIVIVDPGLPDYLRGRFESLLPKLFRYYTDKTGYALKKRPVILISYYPADDLNQGTSGDVLPDVIAFDFRSAKMWEADTSANVRPAFHLLAHEAAHLWNGNRFDSANNEDAPWMHEGGADAFDWLAARDFGVLDDAAFRGEIELKLNRCTNNIKALGLSLSDAIMRKQFDLAYQCGSVMNMMVDAELHDRGGLFAFWRALFAEADRSGGRYSLEQYFATLDKTAGNARLADALRSIWFQTQPDPAAVFRDTLANAGVVIEAGAPSLAFTKVLARKALATVMGQDCDGASRFNIADDRFELSGLPQCHVLKDRNVTVVAIAGRSVKDGGLAIYDAVAERCNKHEKVALVTAESGATIEIDCREPMAPLALYVAITRWPTVAAK